ncbi:MAG TPA: ester cyclase [Solirubrobacteraceae bacterium]|nr:ester cyclase [Solirubrobacteraceae bacterium]
MTDDNRELARRFYALVNAGDADGYMALVADDFVDHEEFPGIPGTKDGVRQFFELFRGAFPDLRMETHETVSEDDLVAVRITMTGTHEGEFLGIQPTGRRIEVAAMDLVRIRDGLAVEHWGVTDTATMLQQLGAIPEGAPAG